MKATALRSSASGQTGQGLKVVSDDTSSGMPQNASYDAGIFDVGNLDEAQRIILTPENGRTTHERWDSETPYLTSLVAENLKLTASSVVVDYGCGVGRLAKELISRHGCRVIGVDISANMRALAERYVGSDKFVACAPEGLDLFGVAFADAALAVWVLQHCPQVEQDLERIRRSLKTDGQLFVVNENRRCIPTDRGWMSDGLDLQQILVSQFDLGADGRMDPGVVMPAVSERTFWARYKVSGKMKMGAAGPASLAVGGANPPVGSENTPGTSIPATTPIAEPAPTSSASAQDSSTQAPVKRAYPAPAEVPTQAGLKGIRFDFNDGCRVVLPEGKHPWQVRLSDLDTGNILFETQIKAGRVNSTKRYFVRIRLEVSVRDKSVLTHDYAAADRDVLIQFPVGTIGDTLGWFPYAVKFKERHGCRLTCGMGEKLIPLFRDAYPDITFLTHEEIKPERYYATYSMGLFFDDKDCVDQPCDFRHVGLHRTAGYILGVDPTETPPRIVLADDSRPISEPYVCIAVQSTTQAKYWNNPNGWRDIVRYLKEQGYRVICIDQKPTHGTGLVWNHIPNGAEDETGDRPLAERARWLKHAEFFIGLSSGLSWLAWALGRPVVMISGFTHPLNEFATPYRVINYHTCNSCWNDPQQRFDHKDFLWCPRHKDTPRQFECSRLITVEQVKAIIPSVTRFSPQRVKIISASREN
jgi:autotransporter strand-loop-strand O-heptosyltransferase